MEKILQESKIHKNNIGITKNDILSLFINTLSFFIGRLLIFRTLNPFAISFLSNYLFLGKGFYITCFCTIIGFITKSEQLYFSKYLFNIMLLLLINIIYTNKFKKANIHIKSITASASSLISGLIYAAIHNFSLYFSIVAILEAVLTFLMTYLLKDGAELFKSSTPKRVINNEEILSLSIIIGGVIAGSADIYIGNVSLMYFFLSIVIMTISYKGGVSIGATSALLLGAIVVISRQSSIDLIITLSMAAISCGLFKSFSKLFSIIGFIIGGTLTAYYLNANFFKIEILYCVVVAGLIFLLLPNKLYISTNNTFVTNINYSQDYINRMKEITENKLNCFSKSFRTLSRTFSGLSEKKTVLDQKDISRLIDDIAAKACSKCDMRQFCWENDFYNTYQIVFGILSDCEKNKTIQIPASFAKKCISVAEFAETTNKLFEIYKLNLMWKNKIIESRELVCEQILSVANILEKLSQDLSTELKFNDNINKNLITELNRNKIPYKNAIVHKTQQNRYEVLISHEPCYGRKSCVNDIIPIVNDVLKRKMIKSCYDCIITKKDNSSLCKLRLIEEKKYRINTAVSFACKNNSEKSGDNYTLMEIQDSNYMLALSDGMGSGVKASIESSASIELFEDFISAGFDKDIAIKIINSVLVLKSCDESFSTLDICTIDLYTGVCEFIKIGAAATFIVRNNKVSIINSNSLPIGILNNVEIQSFKKKLYDSDIIVMVTDGILDSVKSNKENWLANILANYKSTNPKDIADYVLSCAKENQDGAINDDMTVIVARLWESL